MKKYLFAAVAVLMAASCTKENNKCVINGTVADADGQTVYLQYMVGDSTVLDSTVVSDGKFMFTKALDVPYRSAVLIMGDMQTNYGQNATYCQIALEPGNVTVAAVDGKLTDATITGGKTQTEINELNALLKPYTDKFKVFNEQYYAATTQEAKDSLNEIMEPLRKECDAISTNFMKTQTGSYHAPRYLRMNMGSMSYDEIKAVYDAFTDDVKLYGDGIEEIKKELAALENVQPGKDAPDFTTEDINGEQFTLSSLKGKVVILDFWASWCVPCRKSNPHMLELYKKYHDQGLEMVYVSDDDSNPDKWREAVEKDGLTGDGFHHVLRGLITKKNADGSFAGYDDSQDVSHKYAIHFLPTKYLIDREGKMVCRINEGEDEMLDQKLEELLAAK